METNEEQQEKTFNRMQRIKLESILLELREIYAEWYNLQIFQNTQTNRNLLRAQQYLNFVLTSNDPVFFKMNLDLLSDVCNFLFFSVEVVNLQHIQEYTRYSLSLLEIRKNLQHVIEECYFVFDL